MGTAQASDALENLFIDHLFRSTKWTAPSALWVALFTASPSDAGGGIEVVGGGYVRVNLPPADGNWTATQGGTSGISIGTGGMTSNAVAVTYPAPTSDWQTVGWFGLFTASSGGTMLIWDALQAPRTILNGDPAPSFAPGSLQITIQ